MKNLTITPLLVALRKSLLPPMVLIKFYIMFFLDRWPDG